MHLLWIRGISLNPEASDDDLDKALVWIGSHRGELLNLTSKVFSPATADALRTPAMLNVGSAQAQVVGMSFPDKRASALAAADQLLSVLQSKWLRPVVLSKA